MKYLHIIAADGGGVHLRVEDHMDVNEDNDTPYYTPRGLAWLDHNNDPDYWGNDVLVLQLTDEQPDVAAAADTIEKQRELQKLKIQLAEARRVHDQATDEIAGLNIKLAKLSQS